MELIGTGTAAKILDVDTSTVWRLVQMGDIEPAHVQEGGRRSMFFERAEVEALRDQRAERKRRRTALRRGVRAEEREAS